MLASQDDAAFAEIVVRHAPKVRPMCRCVLHHQQDAEDAFQQTFLVLIRRATSLCDKQDIGGWLKVAAYRVSLKIWREKRRREKHESQCQSCLPAQPAQPFGEAVQHEMRDHIDAAIQHLPEILRVPFGLCFLEDMSRTEIARELGWPEGTVANRLAKAQKKVRRELERHGIIP